jgi:glycosyltransferase involved in cell wall biosynthesis
MRRLRLAMFGPICHDGASSAKALFDVTREWLRAGHAVDFFSPGTWIDPADLLELPGFRYTAVPLPEWGHFSRYNGTLQSKVRPAAVGFAVASGLNHAQRVAHEGALEACVRREHATHRYDAYISMNRTCPFALTDALPVVSWTQGPPTCESDFIRREPALVRAECGWAGWAYLRAGYVAKDALERKTKNHSTGIITASEWARSMWLRAGVPGDRLSVIPFPVDVATFHVTPRPARPDGFTFLWLGRIVPRKRLPLALEAFALLRARRPGVRLLIAGGAGYQGMLAHQHFPPMGPGAEHLGKLAPSDIPALLARSDVIFQPSENENFGAAPVEGLACGLPSVVGPTNGTADCLLDTAFRFERYQAHDVAAAMERAMDAVLADPVGIANRARAVAERTLSVSGIAQRGAEAVEAFIEAWHEAKAPRRES